MHLEMFLFYSFTCQVQCITKSNPYLCPRSAPTLTPDFEPAAVLLQWPCSEPTNQTSTYNPKIYNLQCQALFLCSRSAPTLILAECVLIYMDPPSSDRLVAWAAKAFSHAAFITYEQVSADLTVTPLGR